MIRMSTSVDDSCNGFNGGLSHSEREIVRGGSEMGGKFGNFADKKICRNGVSISSPQKLFASNKITVRQLTRHKSEVFLQSLKEFIAERHGFLEDGWHVEFKQRTKKHDMYAVFCSPDGNRFDSMMDVANHLGLVSNDTSMDAQEKTTAYDSLQTPLLQVKKTKNSAGLPRTRDSSDDEISDSLPAERDSVSHQLNVSV